MGTEEPTAFVHPLARSDAHLVQDLMLTKITLLCAQGADDEEWAFELAAMDAAGAPATRGGNTFLFALTLVRYVHALTRATRPDARIRLRAFPAGFVDAVVAGDGREAAAVWFRGAPDIPTSLTAASLRAMTAEALTVIRDVPLPHPAGLTAHLPRPYETGAA
ncbi:hypothetical protein BFL34_01722 [Clavibacter michiganensis]|uniref:Uncharacterized protein n=1 Tax=Clavibacter michiganensis TaxID=28447 RepID=A0A251Y9I5_9MICO|nr:hypothetical protein [Clavibacter michiganensis]OUE20904.1 hypothetical protein BFL34_01722 [Clavibacter michiganensis]